MSNIVWMESKNSESIIPYLHGFNFSYDSIFDIFFRLLILVH